VIRQRLLRGHRHRYRRSEHRVRPLQRPQRRRGHMSPRSGTTAVY
jgi:hypothetical protein